MKQIKDFLYTFIVSPEMIFISIFGLLLYLSPSFFIQVAAKLNVAEGIIKPLALIPLGLLSLIIKQKNEILFPDHELNAVLQKWPNYYLITNRYWTCVLFEGISLMFTGCIWIGIQMYEIDFKNYVVFALFVGGLVVSIITYLTFLNSTITIKRILFTIGQE
ncbi:MAG: hypothetical protein DRI32_07075 [Chloroflexi bacterium]|nr:MAG: hypothetical protein DRI32_07075 [Chloroflexota bacterium]